MPRKIDCPFSPMEMMTLYDEGHSSAIIDAAASLGMTISKDLALTWYKDVGGKPRRFSPYTEKRIDSPFTPARLHEMYWREGKSVAEIGEAAAKILGIDYVYQKTVTRWLTEAKITLRTAAESQAVRARLHPEQFQECIKAARAKQTPESLRAGHGGDYLRKAQPQGSKKAAAIKKARSVALATRPCCWWGCSKTVSRPSPAYFRAKIWFCGHDHRAKYQSATVATQIDCQNIALEWLEEHKK